jgi:hypothetical protein
MTDQTVQLTLRADATLEHPLVDALMTFQPVVPFQVQTVKSFHAHQILTTISDQVAGHLPQIRVTIETNENDCSAILTHIKNDLSHAEIHYWVMPVITHGQLLTT